MNPPGTIPLPIALGRFHRYKWNGCDPFDDLRHLWNIATERQAKWDVSPGSPLWEISGSVEVPAGHGELAAFLNRARLASRIEAILEAEPERERQEFFGAFGSGQLVATDREGNEAATEWWGLFLLGERHEELEDWRSLYVTVEPFERWCAENHQPHGPHTRLSQSRRMVRRCLQTMVLLGAVTREGAEKYALDWGFRRLEDTNETLALDAGVKLRRSERRLAEFVDRIKQEVLASLDAPPTGWSRERYIREIGQEEMNLPLKSAETGYAAALRQVSGPHGWSRTGPKPRQKKQR